MAKRSIRIGTAIAALVMMGGTVAACGGDSSEAYCGDLKDASASFSALGAQDFAGIDKALDTYHELAKEAPSKVKADWEAIDGPLSSLQAALKNAGLELSDLATLRSSQLPDGLDAAKVQKLRQDINKIDVSKVTKAAENITTHAKDVCKISLTK